MAKRKFFWSRETEAESAVSTSRTLAERLAAGPLPLPVALHYAIQLAELLREVHGRNRFHGFLHPAGVIISGDDVRLAPATPAALSPYFSPEQVTGRDLDSRTDIFSLGAILYELLSGKKAFDAPTRPGLRMEILDCDPAPLENIPAPLSRLVRRCLEKRPERRVQRVEILLAELKLQEIFTQQLPAV